MFKIYPIDERTNRDNPFHYIKGFQYGPQKTYKIGGSLVYDLFKAQVEDLVVKQDLLGVKIK